MTRFVVKRENPALIVEEILDTFAQQWDETESWRGTAFKPNQQYFHVMNDTDRMVCVTARDREGRIVGMIILVVGSDPLDQVLYATDSGFYVHPHYRGSTAAVRMLAAALEALDGTGVQRVILDDKQPIGGVDLSGFLGKFGFQMFARKYVRRPS